MYQLRSGYGATIHRAEALQVRYKLEKGHRLLRAHERYGFRIATPRHEEGQEQHTDKTGADYPI